MGIFASKNKYELENQSITENNFFLVSTLKQISKRLCRIVARNITVFATDKEVSGFFDLISIFNLKSGDEHSVQPPVVYGKEMLVGFHTHPNDYNEILYDENDVIDLPSGADIESDIYHPMKNEKGLSKNIYQAVINASLRHKQVGVFLYKQLMDCPIKNHTVISGYYQLVKIFYLDFSKQQAIILFNTVDSNAMNSYLKHLKKDVIKNDKIFNQLFYGPKNSEFGTFNWPWKKEHFKFELFATPGGIKINI